MCLSVCVYIPLSVCVCLFPCMSAGFPPHHWTMERSRKLTIIVLILSPRLTAYRLQEEITGYLSNALMPLLFVWAHTHIHMSYAVLNVWCGLRYWVCLLTGQSTAFCLRFTPHARFSVEMPAIILYWPYKHTTVQDKIVSVCLCVCPQLCLRYA